MAFDLPGTKRIQRTTNLPSTTLVTFCGWFRLDTFADGPVLFDLGPNNATGSSIELYVNSSGQLGLWNGASFVDGTTLSTGVWYHLALTCSGTDTTDLKSYLNGVEDSTLAGASRTVEVATIGGWPGNTEILNGQIEAAKLFNAVLTAGEISTESTYINSPYSAANVKAWIPGEPEGTFLDDQSGNGAFTEVGTGSITFIAGQSLPTYVAAGNGYYYMRNQ